MNSNYTVKFIQIKFYSVNSNDVLMFSILWRLLILNLFLIIYMFKGRLHFIVKYVHSWSFSIGFSIPPPLPPLSLHLFLTFLICVCNSLFKICVCVFLSLSLFSNLSLSLSVSLFFNLLNVFLSFVFQ